MISRPIAWVGGATFPVRAYRVAGPAPGPCCPAT